MKSILLISKMSKSTDSTFKCPRRTTRGNLCLLTQEMPHTGNINSKKEMKRKCPPAKSRNTEVTGQVFEKRLTRSSSKNALNECLPAPDHTTGVLTRHRTKSLIMNHFEAIRELKYTQLTKSSCADSGYCTSSDSSKDCAESVTSNSRESFGSALNESIKSLDINACSDETKTNFGSPYPLGFSKKASEAGCIKPKKGHSKKSRTSILNMRCSNIKVILLTEKNVKAFVPLTNKSNYTGPFKLQVEDHVNINRESLGCNMRVHHVSSVVSVEPQGISFHENFPAILVIPLKVEPRDINWLCCFYSDCSLQSTPMWQRLPKRDYYYSHGFLVVTTRHFSLFTVILEEPYPEIFKKIRCRTGGRLRLPDVPGIEVNFPRGCLEHDIDACLRVLFDNEPGFDKNCAEIRKNPLASPVISLGPHGLEFNEERLPVLISLPIPDYQEIMKRCPNAKLIAYESSTADGEPMVWQKIDFEIPEPTVIGYCHGISGIPIPVVTFPVYHFSFFKVVWELLSSTLYEAKMGMSYFYPYISFSMMCQAFMEESQGSNGNRFGLEVVCFRSDRKLPGNTNYRRRVGAGWRPKLVRPGRISVKLRSEMFEADVEAGEDPNMVKEEPDFRGRDFEKQYACKFKPESNVEFGTFGKVIVERISTKHDPLFEFNLDKTEVDTSAVPSAAGGERCAAFMDLAFLDLAASLKITEGSNWKELAKFVGFTNSEIENKLFYSPNPFLTLVNLYNNRGGNAENFVQALYCVSKDIMKKSQESGNVSPGSGISNSSNHSAGSGSLGSGSQDSKDSPMKRLWNFKPWSQGNPDSDSAESNARGSAASSGKKRPRPGPSQKTALAPKRRKFSDASETVQSTTCSSSDDELEDQKAQMKYKTSAKKLRDKDLWRISLGVARRDWRNLGRTLGIEETVLINLEHSHQSVGFRECAYQMLLEWKSRKPKKCTFGELYSALIREKMVSVAKFMVQKIGHAITPKDEGSDST